jgi:ATP-dependent Lhr-like helicase
MSLSRFHPVVQKWFTSELGEPTAAQRRGWAAIGEGRHTLIAAPTGSGKTLAAFLTALDGLFKEGLVSPLPDEVRVLYISPLKALSADIHKNLAEPRRGIQRLAEDAGLPAPRITAAVRTGDTTQSERAAMLRTPPHILVTTPESLYLLLTSDGSRQMLRTVRTVIVDEIHAVIGTRRGAHLALSLERLRLLTGHPLLRLGLSATQKPIDEVSRFLVGLGDDGGCGCTIVDEGHRRRMDLGVEIPGAPLEPVMSREVWEEYYDRLTALIREHKTTLVFVNTRRLAERLARHLSDRLGEDAVTAHHGSLSKETRLDAETRLKTGRIKALVATASLELGIDIGHVDLVCQIGSPHRIATLLQRVGRSGHTVAGTPKGRIFAVSRDDLVECAALLRSIGRGELDAIVPQDAPLDVLAQQIVAESSCRPYGEDELFDLVRRAWPYRALARGDFDAVVRMTADGFSTRRGRRSALVHRDEVNHTVRGRRGARLLAQTSGGAIPEVADYRVVLEPDDTFIGTLNEDFAIESMTGDIFQLGNTSWRVLQVAGGTVRVADARGLPPNIPFWFGEAPARSDELSRAVSDLRADMERRLEEPPVERTLDQTPVASGFSRTIIDWLISETGLSPGAAEQVVAYVAEGRRALGVVPTQATLVLERFFDESGGMQLVLHAPFGSRINKAWGLALRKRFCRQFNFELQAAATEDALLLSLGPQHSFPLADVFRYLHPATTRDVLVQAFLDAPVFQTRWRWNATVSLAVPRSRGGRKVAPQVQRMLADDLMAAVFPDAAACLENIPGDRQIPDHPLVGQTVRDCLQEAMDFEGLSAVLERIHRGELALVARDTPEPSFFAHEILNAKPYAFLDDAPLEERRAHAVQARRTGEPSFGGDLGALDPSAIARVRAEAAPDPRDADELHDALMLTGFLTEAEVEGVGGALMDRLVSARRACRVSVFSDAETGKVRLKPDSTGRFGVVIAAERIPEALAIHPAATLDPPIAAPASRAQRVWRRDEAIAELLRGRLTIAGPTTADALAGSLGISRREADAALLALETDGVVLRGRFSPGPVPNPESPASARSGLSTRFGAASPELGAGPTDAPSGGGRIPDPGSNASLEWCDRALLARIHGYTLHRLRADIEPISPAGFMRFLFAWHHVEPSARLTGIDGLREVLGMLDGFELAAGAWERAVLPARVIPYEPQMLDMLCLAGEIGWARLSSPVDPARLVPATPVALFLREHGEAWQRLRGRPDGEPRADEAALSDRSRAVLETLRSRGASFFNDLGQACGLDADDLRQAIGALVASGLAASDGFSGVRALVQAALGRPPARHGRANFAGRWSALRADVGMVRRESDVETLAWTLLRRYGVVFHRLLTREATAVPWRELSRVFRRLEARGEIRGGRFVSGVSGEQFALADAVARLREIRRTRVDGRLITISAADPLNLSGIVTAGDRIRAARRNRIVYRDGIPLAVMEGDCVRELAPIDPAIAADVSRAFGRRAARVV